MKWKYENFSILVTKLSFIVLNLNYEVCYEKHKINHLCVLSKNGTRSRKIA